MMNVVHVKFPARSCTINVYIPSQLMSSHEAYIVLLSVAPERCRSSKVIHMLVG